MTWARLVQGLGVLSSLCIVTALLFTVFSLRSLVSMQAVLAAQVLKMREELVVLRGQIDTLSRK